VDPDLAFAGIARQAELLRANEISSRELTRLYLDRIERFDRDLNAFRVVLGERALAEAEDADRRLAGGEEGALLGVPLALKDTDDLAGELTTLGTGAYKEPAIADAELVRRLREAGVVIIGKTNMPELAICGFTESTTWGATRNPWALDRTPGGSSGGSGVAVAAGLVAAASGSDGAGSIRIPAAFCGLVGLKPQRGRVPLSPGSEHWYGLTVNGCLTRSVLDTALYLDAVTAGPQGPGSPPTPERPYAEQARISPGRLRIAISAKPLRELAPPIVRDEVLAGLDDAAELLRSLGHGLASENPSYGLAANHITTRYLGRDPRRRRDRPASRAARAPDARLRPSWRPLPKVGDRAGAARAGRRRRSNQSDLRSLRRAG
jgi:amidase